MASIWVSRPDLEDLIGVDATQALLSAYPGGRVYVGRKPERCKFALVVGPVAAEILCGEFPGLEIMLPSAAAKPPTLKQQIVELLEQGVSYSQIVARLGCTERHVAGTAADARLRLKDRAQKARTGTDGEA